MIYFWLFIGLVILVSLVNNLFKANVADAEAFYYANVKAPILIASTSPFDHDVMARVKDIQEKLAANGNQWNPPLCVYLYGADLDKKSTLAEDFTFWQLQINEAYKAEVQAWQMAKVKAVGPEIANKIILNQNS